MFSTLYTPLLLILFALIIRAVSFEFRGKIEGRGWRRLWDTCLCVGSFAPALLFGVAFANIFQGIPFMLETRFPRKCDCCANLLRHPGRSPVCSAFCAARTSVVGDKDLGCPSRPAWPLSSCHLGNPPGRGGHLSRRHLVCDSRFTIIIWQIRFLFLIPLVTVVALLAVRMFTAKAKWWTAGMFVSGLTILTATLFGVIGLNPIWFRSAQSDLRPV